MLMKAKERWHCTTLACGCQIAVEISGEIEGLNPRCACGGHLKKKYVSSTFAYLGFFHAEDPLAAEQSSYQG
jgi:hypothetical protein